MLIRPSRTESRSMFLAVALAVVLGGVGLLVPAARAEAPAGHRISLHVGESADVTQAGMNRLSVANPSIADAHPVDGDHLAVHAVSPGKTTLLVWGKDHRRVDYVIEVTE